MVAIISQHNRRSAAAAAAAIASAAVLCIAFCTVGFSISRDELQSTLGERHKVDNSRVKFASLITRPWCRKSQSRCHRRRLTRKFVLSTVKSDRRWHRYPLPSHRQNRHLRPIKGQSAAESLWSRRGLCVDWRVYSQPGLPCSIGHNCLISVPTWIRWDETCMTPINWRLIISTPSFNR